MEKVGIPDALNGFADRTPLSFIVDYACSKAGPRAFKDVLL